jgi:hypothetical protein
VYASEEELVGDGGGGGQAGVITGLPTKLSLEKASAVLVATTETT